MMIRATIPMPIIVPVSIPVGVGVVVVIEDVSDAIVAEAAVMGVILWNRLLVAKLLTGGMMPPGTPVNLSLRNAWIASGSYSAT